MLNLIDLTVLSMSERNMMEEVRESEVPPIKNGDVDVAVVGKDDPGETSTGSEVR